MVKRNQKPVGQYWILVVAGILWLMAWLMAVINMLYPPIPMFIAALAAGMLFRGRAAEAARAGALAGLAAGLPAEWIYFSQRSKLLADAWAGVSFWEAVGLGLAEGLLYAALLAFFAAFISWSTESSKSAHNIQAMESEDGKIRK